PTSIFNLGGMKISRRNCVHCQKCVEVCPTESMVSKPYFQLAEVLDPTKIKPYPYKPTKEDLKNFEPEILTFFCHWCTYGGADLAGTSRMQYPPNTRVIRTTCTGRIDIQFILEALVLGADGVIVSGCLPDQCHYKEGNYKAVQRVTFLKRVLDAIGFGGERISMHHISASMAPQFVEMISERVDVIKKLGPNPLRGMRNRDRKFKSPSAPVTTQQTISEVH
ncbi:MAG: hydrogenase iron-sulfur subunit, partial [Candidatus Hodarchaeota archaeon]